MNKTTTPTKKDTDELVAKIDAEAAAQNKTSFVYLAEQSDDLRRMFIRWHKESIEELENIKSLRA